MSHQPGKSKPYHAGACGAARWHKEVYLGSFATAEEAALWRGATAYDAVYVGRMSECTKVARYQ